MRGLSNFTGALSPKDSEFLCTFKLTNRIYSSIAQSVERRTVNPHLSLFKKFEEAFFRLKTMIYDNLMMQYLNYTYITQFYLQVA